MHVLFLTSAHPNLNHSQSAETVLTALMKEIARFGHKVSWAVDCPVNCLDGNTRTHLEAMGVRFLNDFSDEIDFGPRFTFKPRQVLHTVRKAFLPMEDDDAPWFHNPKRVADRIRGAVADVAVLYWDSWFENLLPELNGLPIVAYSAKPRYEAPMTCIEGRLRGTSENPIKRWLVYRMLKHQRERHFRRMRRLAGFTNIHADDAMMYERAGIKCGHVPNTWPDAYGPDWAKAREEAEARESGFGILGSMGTVHTTGNLVGIAFWAKEVLPHLERGIGHDNWVINMCGRGLEQLPEDIARRLKHSHVVWKGFVPDIDREVLANGIFLMCNNAGPYSGGYTRVIHAMSSGSCLLAHRHLARSMPEVKHGYNALLGESGEEIASLLVGAYRDPELRKRIGKGARETYERCYRPAVVAEKLLELCGGAIKTWRGQPS
jgi:glycosyltransferase involved in cell wall biosynthesis